ncbi:RNA-directed DNA polymerase [Mesorhizobium japonicum]|uniref:RNA-directed DNA polymerase n=1 Tax=Mesorhizobium japonicum R7A TaxID=935547 RepID=A0ABX6MP24_9HYPH|nr:MULTISPECIES: RNA-directed DNA polymerase [Mesorhizobium]MBE1706727.1 RNA-directed DNA polymerase [Mesorhizobium japonicum]MBE1714762.1 RNA-directed DNA polymerase [Mesorhizobium japonicum]QJF01083.1 RNA-directed DNA polymerase [Mesorhizobium japonicum R7A]QJF07154.1 RNA-directed DNA polymerase [Mesorhizobium japonicum]QJI83025.1 RNA-directed DNA polymerase [Mesorhizobium japonicum]
MSEPSPELFLSKGLFPENLPSVFTSRNLWAGFTSLGTNYGILRESVGEAAVYSASKRGGQRRIFNVPHPAFVRDQALYLQKHWPDISPLLQRSTGSVSRPSFFDFGPRHVKITSHSELPKLRLRALSRFNFCLVTDVSRFYPSIYTHSLPWAINGKAAAKADIRPQSTAVIGNRLDFILRQSQSRQTIGIAIGPDVSKVIAEILMSSVDREFIARSGSKQPVFVRHVDDYWVGGRTYEECEKHLTNLRIALREHELDINEAKTKIISTKYVFGDDWPFDFEDELQRNLSGPFLKQDPLPTLSKIVDLATNANDDGIIRRVIRKIDDWKRWSPDWDILEHFLAQCAVQFPHSFDYAARVVAWRVRTHRDVDRDLWIEIARTTAFAKGLAGHDSEAAWALWLLKELGQKIPKAISDAVIESSGSLVLALVAHFGANKALTDRRWAQKLRDTVGSNPLAGTHWPLVLELQHLGLADASWHDPTLTPSLRLLYEQRRSIVDWTAPPHVFGLEGIDVDHGRGPDNALEDYGDDYGDFSDEPEEDDETEGEAVNFKSRISRPPLPPVGPHPHRTPPGFTLMPGFIPSRGLPATRSLSEADNAPSDDPDEPDED